ncbi:MAG: ornithine cyclodeaminase family protein [Chloroflexota bacterium]|nr:ornithine cyclodeaminase family protein [Chloroflexota bacterium]
MPLLLSEAEVDGLISMPDVLMLVEEVFAYTGSDRPSNQPRRRVGSGRGTLNVMFSALPGREVMGLKAYPTSPGGVNFTVLLYSSATSELLGIIEAGRLGQLRTGAATGVATKYLAREEARTLGVFGAGTQAETQIEAVAGVRDLERVQVYARRAESARSFCSRMTLRTGLVVEPVESPRAILENEIVITATSATKPVFDGQDVRPGSHINAIGSNFASKAEVDVEVVRCASLVVVDALESARIEGGDLLPAIDRGVLAWERVEELGDIVSGRAEGRRTSEDITLFKSHGIASEDIVLAHELYLRAQQQGLGRQVAMFGQGR